MQFVLTIYAHMHTCIYIYHSIHLVEHFHMWPKPSSAAFLRPCCLSHDAHASENPATGHTLHVTTGCGGNNHGHLPRRRFLHDRSSANHTVSRWSLAPPFDFKRSRPQTEMEGGGNMPISPVRTRVRSNLMRGYRGWYAIDGIGVAVVSRRKIRPSIRPEKKSASVIGSTDITRLGSAASARPTPLCHLYNVKKRRATWTWSD